jgi:uncharacterized membrane protein YphA (DoxX/SURF4 family)
MRILLSKPLQLAIRFMIGGVFVVAGYLKLQDPRGFAMVIDGYGLVPGRFDLPLAYGLSWLEVISGIGLIFNMRWALELVIAQLALFIVVLGYGMHIGLNADCGCFGADDPLGQAYHSMTSSLIRDVVMLIGCGLLFWKRVACNEPPRPFSVFLKPFRGARR